jgi:hypothetical protein
VHGVVFHSLRDYLVAEHGRSAANAVFGAEPEYLLSEAYPDEVFGRLVDRAAAHTGRDTDEILFELGVFTGETTFTRLYPAFFAAVGSPREFLLTVEDRIHELVRATIPSAGPPRLTVGPLGDDGVTIAYESPRRLCVLLRGLTEGTARHYRLHAEIEEPTCMLRGDDACTFEVSFSEGVSA